MTPAQLLEEQRRRTLGALRAANLGVQDVWIRYFMMTGNVDEYDINAYLHGLIRLPVLDCYLIALAINELIDEQPPLPRAPTAPTSDPAPITAPNLALASECWRDCATTSADASRGLISRCGGVRSIRCRSEVLQV
ncbi:hypothetical protein [Arthrobacter sp. N1]|uniref:hypothetical protein n=1 Tax=Arthrobacter sp. N1 TaxID=619291 RepID=UPI003BB02672